MNFTKMVVQHLNQAGWPETGICFAMKDGVIRSETARFQCAIRQQDGGAILMLRDRNSGAAPEFRTCSGTEVVSYGAEDGSTIYRDEPLGADGLALQCAMEFMQFCAEAQNA